MTNENFESFVKNTFTKIEKLLIEKGGEYASTDDRLSHFKEAGQFLNIPSEQALMSMAAKHILSIQRLTKEGGTWEMWSEKIGDAIAYYTLLWALVQEKYGTAADNNKQVDKLIQRLNQDPGKYGDDTEDINRARVMHEAQRLNQDPHPGLYASSLSS